MSGQLMRPGREPRDTTNGYVAYFGTFVVDESAHTVIHHVEASLTPAWVGTDLKRTYRFSGNRLTLTAITGSVLELVWEREPD
jgi:hypothetical protein